VKLKTRSSVVSGGMKLTKSWRFERHGFFRGFSSHFSQKRSSSAGWIFFLPLLVFQVSERGVVASGVTRDGARHESPRAAQMLSLQTVLQD